jgi:quercetin dioxygenase-like cupin family protein
LEENVFCKADESGFIQVLPGIQRKTLTYGESTLFTEFRLAKGCILPRHLHPYEQTGYLVKGALLLTIGNQTYDVNPGDSWCINANVEHFAEIREDSVAIEVFSPVREDYLPENT